VVDSREPASLFAYAPNVEPRRHADEQDEAESAPEAIEAMYRVSGNVVARAAELELALAESKRELRALEREVYAARAKLRARTALRTTSIGGLGSLVGTLVGSVAYAITDKPGFLIGATVMGFIFGAIGGARSTPPDDKFPDAPPPRMY
jgi:F0F1-type ATP synthase assembly protein I